MEFIWRTGEHTQIFSHLLYHHYSSPPFLKFDKMHDDYEPVYDEERMIEKIENKIEFWDHKDKRHTNLPDLSNSMLKWVHGMQKHYRSNELLVPMGDDYTYQFAEEYFHSTEQLIKYFNHQYGEKEGIKL